jgi:hypothetical protein
MQSVRVRKIPVPFRTRNSCESIARQGKSNVSRTRAQQKCKKATEEQKAACWAKLFADKKERQEKKSYPKLTPSGQVNQLFANNIYASGNSSNANSNSSAPVVTTSGPSSKKVKFTKKTHHANMVSVRQIVVNYNGQTNLTAPRVSALKGVPPVHQVQRGENPMNYWLLDSGTSAHMTPYRTDIDTIKVTSSWGSAMILATSKISSRMGISAQREEERAEYLASSVLNEISD